MKRLYPAFFAVSLVLASCTIASGVPTLDYTDMSLFQTGFMSSYYAERAGAPGGFNRGIRALTPFSVAVETAASRATVPVNQPTWSNLAFTALTTATPIAEYPEPGQSSSFTAVLVPGTPSGTKVYDVTVTTTFPSTDVRKNYVEEYYVQDVGLNAAATPWNTGATPDGVWKTADPIVKQVGGAWVLGTNDYLTQDQGARVKMVLTFKDGSTRNETIVSSSLAGGPLLDPASFAITGSLDLSQAYLPKATTDSSVQYSSVVMYSVSPAKSYSFWFWTGTSQQTILGIRYYTELLSGSTYTSYTTSFEKTINTLTTTGGSFTTTLQTVLVGSVFDTLAESVLRQQVIYSLNADNLTPKLSTGAVTTNMQTRVVNIAGKKDFFLTQLNSDQVSLASWDTSTIYIPTGSDDEVLAGDATAAVFTRTQQVTPATGTLPFAVATADVAGYGDLGTLYTSITEGAASQTLTSAPAALTSNSNLMSSGTAAYTFTGAQVAGTPTTVTLDLSQKGTVEAWIYINKMTDTAGIVHKGVKVDFSDECFSLQGWGSTGQFAIVLDAKGTGNTYDMVGTAKNLKTKNWYYLAATWDTATKKINLYLNGQLSASGTMNTTATGVRDTGISTDVLVGSQLPSIYNTTWGYFGFDGRIVGANVRATAMTAAEVLAQYTAVSPNTSSW